MLVFEEKGKREYPEKNLSEQGREPTTNSTHVYVTESGDLTRATLVGGEYSHHCAIPDPPFMLTFTGVCTFIKALRIKKIIAQAQTNLNLPKQNSTTVLMTLLALKSISAAKKSIMASQICCTRAADVSTLTILSSLLK